MATHVETSGEYVYATYLIEDSPQSLKKRAQSIAVGLTVGSWTDLPATRQASMQKYCGVVDDIEEVATLPDDRVQAKITIGYPVRNLTSQVSALLTTVFGKLSMDGRIRLIKLRLPQSYLLQFPGPKYGVKGVRDRFSVHHRPLLMSIFKSCIGNTMDELTEHFAAQARGGVDLIKDDEIFFSEEHATPEERVSAFRTAAIRLQDETGKRVRYAVNLTGPVHELRERAKRLSELGADVLLFNVVAYGYDVMKELASDTSVDIPLMAHPAVAGALYASPHYGISASIILGQLMRMVGADIVIFPSPYGSVTLPMEEGSTLVDSLRQESAFKVSLPAPSAGIHPGLVPLLMRDFGTDFIVNAGGGIHGHPDGATAGGRAFVQAIDAVMNGVALQSAAATQSELRRALDVWGCPQL